MNLNYRHLELWTVAFLALASVADSAAAQPTNRVDARDFEAFQIVNDRNIFDPNRRPRVEGRTRTTPRTPQIVDSFSLVGTMSYSNLLLAFFDGTSSDYRKTVGVGDRIANHTALEIQHNMVRLSSGTNQVDLKIGMQMRRSEDGRWTAAEVPVVSSSSYAGNRMRGNDRRSSWGRGDSGRSGDASAASNDSEAAAVPPNLGNLDPSDPVARMMLRRMQEEGIAPPVAGPDGGPGEPTNYQSQTENQSQSEGQSQSERQPQMEVQTQEMIPADEAAGQDQNRQTEQQEN